MPFVSRTRATLRSAELGFFGVEMKTRMQTPRFLRATLKGRAVRFRAGSASALFEPTD